MYIDIVCIPYCDYIVIMYIVYVYRVVIALSAANETAAWIQKTMYAYTLCAALKS